MFYNYVDIGTSDFDTAADVAKPGDHVLLVEPVKYYLDRIPNANNQVKVHAGVSSASGTMPVYYVPDITIHTFNLPGWIRGCNSIGTRHPTVDSLLTSMGLPLSLVAKVNVNVITFEQLCSQYQVTEIDKLKIDTEGHETFILPSVFEMVRAGMVINEIKFENQEVLGNKQFLDLLAEQFVLLGNYTISEVTPMDTTLTRRK